MRGPTSAVRRPWGGEAGSQAGWGRLQRRTHPTGRAGPPWARSRGPETAARGCVTGPASLLFLGKRHGLAQSSGKGGDARRWPGTPATCTCWPRRPPCAHAGPPGTAPPAPPELLSGHAGPLSGRLTSLLTREENPSTSTRPPHLLIAGWPAVHFT